MYHKLHSVPKPDRNTEVQQPWRPQVKKTGVDAVHEKLPTEGLYHEEL